MIEKKDIITHLVKWESALQLLIRWAKMYDFPDLSGVLRRVIQRHKFRIIFAGFFFCFCS